MNNFNEKLYEELKGIHALICQAQFKNERTEPFMSYEDFIILIANEDLYKSSNGVLIDTNENVIKLLNGLRAKLALMSNTYPYGEILFNIDLDCDERVDAYKNYFGYLNLPQLSDIEELIDEALEEQVRAYGSDDYKNVYSHLYITDIKPRHNRIVRIYFSARFTVI